jgi:hypothetical protein
MIAAIVASMIVCILQLYRYGREETGFVYSDAGRNPV